MWDWRHRFGNWGAGLPVAERRARRREVAFMLLAAVVFVALAIVEIRTPVLGGGDALVGNVVFFLLINLNLVLLVLMVFLVIRNFARLALERRRRILGARLRTRRVLAFVAVTWFPMLFLFGVGQVCLGRAFATWFRVGVGRSRHRGQAAA